MLTQDSPTPLAGKSWGDGSKRHGPWCHDSTAPTSTSLPCSPRKDPDIGPSSAASAAGHSGRFMPEPAAPEPPNSVMTGNRKRTSLGMAVVAARLIAAWAEINWDRRAAGDGKFIESSRCFRRARGRRRSRRRAGRGTRRDRRCPATPGPHRRAAEPGREHRLPPRYLRKNGRRSAGCDIAG